MEEKKIEISLSTIILIIIILGLIMTGVWYYLNYMKKGESTQAVQEHEVEEIQGVAEENIKLTETEFPKVDGATAMLPMIGQITKYMFGYTDEQAQEFLDENTHGNTAEVYEKLINKELDLIFVSEPSNDILKQAQEAGVEFEMQGIGYDGFVFIINKQNSVKSLTLEQIQKIYTGEITNWKEVGGEDSKIVAYQREANSGSQNLMEKMVMKDLKMKEPESASLKIESMAGIIDAISNFSNAKDSIGYSIYLYAKEQYVKDNVEFLSINGVYPSDETIADGTYPLTKVVYAVCRKDEPQDSNVRKLMKWLETEEGQKAVVAGGYTGLKK